MMNSYYGGFRTPTLAQIWKSESEFLNEFRETPFYAHITSGNPAAQLDLELTFFLLYARYGNSHIANSDINQFKYGFFSRIFMYGPSWAIRLSSQKALRELSLDQLREGTISTYNNGSNPGYIQGISEPDGIKIDSQSKTLHNRSILDAYANLLSVVETDVTEDFINKFKNLFTKVAAADENLLYITREENTLYTGDN